MQYKRFTVTLVSGVCKWKAVSSASWARDSFKFRAVFLTQDSFNCLEGVTTYKMNMLTGMLTWTHLHLMETKEFILVASGIADQKKKKKQEWP